MGPGSVNQHSSHAYGQPASAHKLPVLYIYPLIAPNKTSIHRTTVHYCTCSIRYLYGVGRYGSVHTCTTTIHWLSLNLSCCLSKLGISSFLLYPRTWNNLPLLYCRTWNNLHHCIPQPGTVFFGVSRIFWAFPHNWKNHPCWIPESSLLCPRTNKNLTHCIPPPGIVFSAVSQILEYIIFPNVFQ